MVRYSLLHRRIIHTTLLFNREFSAANWSWLSCIHNNLWNDSWIIINSPFQSLVSPHITCIHLIYRHDTFLHSNIHMVWGLLPVPIHGICHKQTLTCMGPTYTLDMTNLVGVLQNLFTNFCLWTCCLIPFSIGLLVTIVSINNIFIWVHVIVGFPTNANIKSMIIISGSYRTYPHTFQA